MTTTDKIALDTNILLYLHEVDPQSTKKPVAEELVASNPVISTQVISEYLNVCSKRLKLPKSSALDALMSWLQFCEIANISQAVYITAAGLIKRYDFQLFDAVVVAAALESSCTILYSEDMNHNLLVEKRLRIINPFQSS